MTASELLGTVAIGMLMAIVLGAMAWQDYCRERDQAARSARQQRHARQQQPATRNRPGDPR